MSVEIFRKKFRFLKKESGGTSPMPDWKKPRVLHVANDDGQLLRALLTRDGHEVTEADGTSQALNLTALEQFDCIVIERPSPRESVLRESEKRFRVTFEQAAVGVAHSSLRRQASTDESEAVRHPRLHARGDTYKDLPGGHPPGRPSRGTGVRAPPALGRDQACLV